MTNISRVTPHMWTGGDLPGERDVALAALDDWDRIGITHVIDNRIEWSDEQLVAEVLPHVDYLHNGVDDAGQAMPDSWFDTGVQFALEAWAADPDAIVIAHCHMGINRGPSMAYAILLALGWDPVEAIDRIRTARPIAAVGYAEDALAWHLRRTGATMTGSGEAHALLRRWRSEHSHDTVRIIRSIRAGEQLAS